MKIRIRKRQLIFLYVVLVLMEPGIFKNEQYQIIDNMYSLLKLINFSFIGMWCYKNKKISLFSVSVIFYELLILFSTIINGNGIGGLRVYAGPALAAMGISLIFDLFEDKLYEYVKILRNVFVGYYIINAISVIIVYISEKGGLQDNFVGDGISVFFLGIDNRFVFCFLPGLICALIVSLQVFPKPDSVFWAILIQSVLILFFLWSVGAFLTMVLILIFFMFVVRHLNGKIMNIGNLILFWILINLCLIYIVRAGNMSQLVQLAESYLGKGANLNIRFKMWKNALDFVVDSPIIGIGVKNKSQIKAILYGYAHAHNLFINIMLRGGCITIISFLGMLFIATKPLMNIKKSFLGCSVAFCLFCALVLSLADSYDDVYFYMILSISYHIEKIRHPYAYQNGT